MAQRGRPRHPDILTPREWDVLTLVREGLSNPEIAERLGISRDAVKYHVSEILGKLELRSREEAAAWEPGSARAAVMRPAWASAGAIGGLLARLPLVGRAALIGTASAAVAGVVALGVVIGVGALSGDDDGSGAVEVIGSPTGTTVCITIGPTPPGSTSVPCATASSPSLPSATLPGGAPIPESSGLQLGKSTSIPAGWSMVLETGCFQCDGSATGLVRIWVDGGGVPHMDKLFGPVGDGLPDYPAEHDYTPSGVTDTRQGISVGASNDGRVLAVSYCTTGCSLGGLGGPGANDLTAVYRSIDGGVTWEELARIAPAAYTELVLPDGQVVVSTSTDETGTTYTPLPGGGRITPPSDDDVGIVALSDGTIGWIGKDGNIYDSANALAVDLPEGVSRINSFVAIPDPAPGVQRAAVRWTANGGYQFLSAFAPEGQSHWQWLADPYWLGAAAPDGRIVADAAVTAEMLGLPASEFPLGTLPVFIDFEAGTMEPITTPFLNTDYPDDRYRVHAIDGDRLVRVAGTDSCLNIRAQPDPTSESLACVPDGVLLHDSGEGASVYIPDGGEWLHAFGNGVSGWVDLRYIER